MIQESTEITKMRYLIFLIDNVSKCIFTLGSKIIYKGGPDDEIPTVSSIFKKGV